VPGQDPAADSVPRQPLTSEQLVRDLRQLGVAPGQTLLVHASLRSIGRVAGGAPAVVEALRGAVGPTGNVVAPTGTEGNSLTSRAYKARAAQLAADEARAYSRTMRAFDKDVTPTTMGAISEALRTAGGAVRSAHPQSSFAAVGPQAGALMADHSLECHLGQQSPLAKLYELGAYLLFLGVGYEACTAFHLAEYLYKEEPPRRRYWCVVMTDGWEHWVEFEDVVLDDGDFAAIGEFVTDRIAVNCGYVGDAKSRLVPMAQLVDQAIEWMKENRN
jgi:aminoglycoside 3-N-acetyltransferase